ncbi:VOC family protein (plasmid) [Embleya sp. NBC_00888]|uniref:bleomycin resistance protein n=1 Tax=Embleya sp. NBC_00888 TaxID=2975960 RepID=UPI002F9194B5|nr:VOC family protein [Embleya sp. NBC_00888]
MSDVRLTGRTAPILPSRDLRATIGFYTRLGFTVDGHYPEEGYLIVGRDDVEVHFSHTPAMDPRKDAGAVYLRLDDAVARVYEEWDRLDISGDPTATPRLVPPSETDYGMVEFALVDIDGNLFRIGNEDTTR